MIETEPAYDVLENERGDVMFMIGAWTVSPSVPRLVYDGRGQAILFRHPDQGLRFVGLPQPTRALLAESRLAYVLELSPRGAIRYSYRVPVLMLNPDDPQGADDPMAQVL